MERIVFFGKGGIGKSTTSTNISAALAGAGRRVLHVGCDPKHDSTVALLKGKVLEPVVDKIQRIDGVTPEDIVTRSHLGVDCVEAGGPDAGVGCGGRGITRMLEIFNAAGLLSPTRYDTCIYDVLGDVVCGGFAAPLRKGIGEKVVIVSSEEAMAIYAANNIAKAVVHYADNGISLAGIIVNLRDNHEDRGPVERFAKLINTQILGYVLRDSLIREAEFRRMTVVEYAPAAPIARTFRELGELILAINPRDLPLPTPLPEAEFYESMQRRFAAAPSGIQSEVSSSSAAEFAASERDPTVVPMKSLVRPPVAAEVASIAAPAIDREQEYRSELRAGARAVRLGRVSLDEAIGRLKSGFPVEAAALTMSDLRA